MEDIRTRPLSAIESFSWREWLPQAIVLAYLTLGMVVYVAVPILAINWLRLPFMGSFLEPTMIFNSMNSSGEVEQWSAHQQGLTFGDQLIALDGKPVFSAVDLSTYLKNYNPGDQVTITAKTPEGTAQDYQIALTTFPLNDRFAFFYVPYFIGLVYLGSAFWVFIIRRSQSSGRAFTSFGSSRWH